MAVSDAGRLRLQEELQGLLAAPNGTWIVQFNRGYNRGNCLNGSAAMRPMKNNQFKIKESISVQRTLATVTLVIVKIAYSERFFIPKRTFKY